MSEGHRQRRLEFEWGIQLELLFGGLLQAVGIGQGPGLVWGLYRSRSLGLRSRYIRSFSIIDVLRL